MEEPRRVCLQNIYLPLPRVTRVIERPGGLPLRSTINEWSQGTVPIVTMEEMQRACLRHIYLRPTHVTRVIVGLAGFQLRLTIKV